MFFLILRIGKYINFMQIELTLLKQLIRKFLAGIKTNQMRKLANSLLKLFTVNELELKKNLGK